MTKFNTVKTGDILTHHILKMPCKWYFIQKAIFENQWFHNIFSWIFLISLILYFGLENVCKSQEEMHDIISHKSISQEVIVHIN